MRSLDCQAIPSSARRLLASQPSVSLPPPLAFFDLKTWRKTLLTLPIPGASPFSRRSGAPAIGCRAALPPHRDLKDRSVRRSSSAAFLLLPKRRSQRTSIFKFRIRGSGIWLTTAQSPFFAAAVFTTCLAAKPPIQLTLGIRPPKAERPAWKSPSESSLIWRYRDNARSLDRVIATSRFLFRQSMSLCSPPPFLPPPSSQLFETLKKR